jgi:glyceraldehyde 3-phosphate dehydrogenase
MVNVGINGFGRIGKCVFLQLLECKHINVTAINIPDFDISYFEHYLHIDSNHCYKKEWDISVISKNQIKINGNIITILNSRDARDLDWKAHLVSYLIDATGVYLTTEKAKEHRVENFIMCAPPKDNTPQFMVNGNEEKYNGEKIISNASCTSNSIVPVLKFLNYNYGIINGNFNTIHAATASQKTTDTIKMDKRTCRSIFNNIIPHSTGASKSIGKILPELDGKLIGSAVRVPISNVSLINLNIRLEKETTLEQILIEMEKTNYIKIEKKQFMVSSDFMTTICPSIIDTNGSMNLHDNQFKIMIWYDNEWSYSNKIIQLLETMISFNNDE